MPQLAPAALPTPAAAVQLRLSLLEQAPLFRGLGAAERRELAGQARDRWLRTSESLFRQGEPAAELALLGTGRLKVAQLSPDGEETILRLLGPGELISAPWGPGGLHDASATAFELSHALCWDRAAFESSAERSPRLQRNLLRILGERLRHLEERYVELSTQRVPQRLARALLRLMGHVGRPADGGVLIALSRQDLAQLTGTTLFTVSRILSQWESKGLLSSGREAVVVADARCLARIAEERPLDCPVPGEPLPPGCPLRPSTPSS